MVLLLPADVHGTLQDVPALGLHRWVETEDLLPPMRGRSIDWGGRELHLFVHRPGRATAEGRVEETAEALDAAVPDDAHGTPLRFLGRLQRLQLHSEKVHFQQRLAGACQLVGGQVGESTCLQVVLPLLLNELLLDAAEVDLVPLLHVVVKRRPVPLLVLPSLPLLLKHLARTQGRQVEHRVGRKHRPVCLEELVSREEHAVEHTFAEQEVPHPLADNDVDLARYAHRLHGALKHCDGRT
mmetsp:Transcript_36342/g.100129  ORF Transcript_36342/g.100129 Transcript_36342/m.100129 type:complete len:240 (-) Transcript_36342:485-1204(-)